MQPEATLKALDEYEGAEFERVVRQRRRGSINIRSRCREFADFVRGFLRAMKFSRRLPHELRPNALTELLREKRQAGARILDLTESNPTHAGIEYPAGFLASLAAEAAARYEPEPFGLLSARETIAREYGAPVDRVVLTASTSEAYSWLFKLLCDPGDEVLVPRPSYPLFDYLAALESRERAALRIVLRPRLVYRFPHDRARDQ